MPEHAKKPVPEAGGLPLEKLQQIKDELFEQESEKKADEAQTSTARSQDLLNREEFDRVLGPEPTQERKMPFQELKSLIEQLDRGVNETKVEVAEAAQGGEELVKEGVSELGENPQTLQLEAEAAAAKNELLGVAEDSADEFDKVAKAAEDYIKAQGTAAEEKFVHPNILDLDKFQREEAAEEERAKSEPPRMSTLEIDLDNLDQKLKEVKKNSDEMLTIVQEMLSVAPEIPVQPDFTETDTTVRAADPENPRERVEVPLYSRENVQAFKKLSSGKKNILVDFYNRTLTKGLGRLYLWHDQKLITGAGDRIHSLGGDLTKADDRLSELKDQLVNIDEVLDQTGETLKPKEVKAIEKSRQTLNDKIKKEEDLKNSLDRKIKIEQEKKAGLEKNLALDLQQFSEIVKANLEPYKEEMTKLESDRTNLITEKRSFESLVDGFTNRLDVLKEQMAGLDELAMPRAAKKSFKAVLKRKIGDIEAALKTSQANLTRLENNIIRVNDRLNKGDEKINRWENIRDDLKTVAEPKPEPKREEIKSSYMPRERTEAFEGEKTPAFSATSYIDQWNAISKNDGLMLNKEAVLSSSQRELTLERLESLIRTIRFKGLSERQLKKKVKEKTDLLRAHFGSH